MNLMMQKIYKNKNFIILIENKQFNPPKSLIYLLVYYIGNFTILYKINFFYLINHITYIQ